MELKKWRIHIWIVLPSKVPMERGEFPKKWSTIDIFPETKLCEGKNKIDIYLRKNRHENRKQSNYLLEYETTATSPIEALDLMGDNIETILDILTFQLQAPIPVTNVDVIDFSEPLRVGEEREWAFANSYPRIQKDCGFVFMANWATSINSKLMQERLDASTEASLRWFSKGIASHAIVDQFISFWIALEILTTPPDQGKRVFFKCRKCSYEIKSCPQCSYSSSHFPDTKERIELFITEDLSLDESLFEKLWDTRMIFHGRNKLTPEEIKGIPDLTWELRMIVIEALKRRMGIDQKDRPCCIQMNAVIMDKFVLSGHRKLAELDIQYAKSR